MNRRLRAVPAILASALLALTGLASTAVAQSDSEIIIVTVLEAEPYECQPVGSASIQSNIFADSKMEVPAGGTESTNQWFGFWVTVQNMGCDQWTVVASLDDFTHETEPTAVIPASSFQLRKNDTFGPDFANPGRWSDDGQPTWVRQLPDDLDIGHPTMPGTMTFGGSLPVPILLANTAEYGSPGSATAYYHGGLTNLPTDLEPGDYTATLEVTIQGPD